MINEITVCIARHLDDSSIKRSVLQFITGIIQYVLQLHCASRIGGILTATHSRSVLRDVIRSYLLPACRGGKGISYILLIVKLVCPDVNGTVLYAVGVVHVC